MQDFLNPTYHDILRDHLENHDGAPRPCRPVDLVNEPLLHGGIPCSCIGEFEQGPGQHATTLYYSIYNYVLIYPTWWNAGEQD